LFFAPPSLQSRDNITGIGENSVGQTHVFAACRAEYRGEARANFMQSWGKPDASMERGWYGLGAEKVCLVLKYGAFYCAEFGNTSFFKYFCNDA